MKNVFNTPQHYREIIINNFKTKIVKEKFVGKGIACVFLTIFCPVT